MVDEGTRKGSILIIDDEESILGILEGYLSGRNYEVITAGSGERALEVSEKREFDVALVDLKLPDTSGLDLICRFNNSRPDMKCIVMTAYASLESTIEALRMNVFDYIIKPFDLVKIGEVVDAAYNHSILKKENDSIIERLEVANKKLERNRDDLSRKILDTNKELADANESLKKHVTRLKMLYQMGRDISSNENWSDALDRFLMALCRYLEADGAGLLMFSNDGKMLKTRTSYQVEEALIEETIDGILRAQMTDELITEIFAFDDTEKARLRSCLDMRSKWEQTIIPLLYKGRWLGFLIIVKEYSDRRIYLHDYHFINTIQTILAEEVANADNISRLRNLKDFNETILENIGSGVLKTDKSGKIIFTNKRAREILKREVKGDLHFDDIFRNPFGREGLFGYLISNEASDCSLEGALSIRDQMDMPIRLTSTRIRTDDYEGDTLVAIFEDLTEQKAMEEELRRADRLRSLGELSAGVAHEIRNPLTGIATTAEILKEKLEGEAGKLKYLSVILSEINRLDDIIKNLLGFARPAIPSPSEVSIRCLVEEATGLVMEKAYESKVKLSLNCEIDDDLCLLDRDQIKQVVLNVALNGIQACNDGGELNIFIRKSNNPAFIQVEFADSGEGISKDISDKLYNPFFTTRSNGTGLGLSISRKIIEGHGGRIYHRCEENNGTRFFIEIPKRTVACKTEETAAKVS